MVQLLDTLDTKPEYNFMLLQVHTQMEHLQDKGVQLLYALEESDTTLEHNFCLLQLGVETELELE